MPLVLILARFYLRISFVRSLGVAQDRPSFRAISQEFPARSKKYDGDDISLRRRYWLSPRTARRRAAAESLMRQNAVPGPPAWKRPNAAAMYCMPFFSFRQCSFPVLCRSGDPMLRSRVPTQAHLTRMGGPIPRNHLHDDRRSCSNVSATALSGSLTLQGYCECCNLLSTFAFMLLCGRTDAPLQ